jgi:xanthine dehydrogenase YagR molybdenum-binding subunit
LGARHRTKSQVDFELTGTIIDKGHRSFRNVDTAAAVANAVFHATGKRIRDPPIRTENLI